MPIQDLLQHFNQHFGHHAQVIAQGDPLTLEDGWVVANFFGMRLVPRFETLQNLAGEVIGCQAGYDAYSPQGRPLSSWAPYAVALDENTVVQLDRLIRTAQVLNAGLQGIDRALYLNVHPLHLRQVSAQHGAAFAEILARCGLSPRQVVLQLADTERLEAEHLRQALASYREHGFGIALSHNGGDRSALQALLAHAPDAVLLGRALLRAAELGESGRRELRARAALIREHGALALLLGLSHSAQVTLARRAGVDGYQCHAGDGAVAASRRASW
ncbi:MAG TPA: EAL domain-containing protein [Candidatus Competibacteraceae bacterium]|nr:EAL domain-containing protein [Candidatus Competibacteraceae bacterium]